MRSVFSLLALIPMALASINGTNGVGNAPLQRYVVSAEQAQKIIAAGVASANSINIPQNIAVVDPSGTLIAFLHMDNAYLGSIDLSMKKAKTSILFNGLSSGDLYAAVQPGAPLYSAENSNGGLVVFGGGFPIYLNGSLIGGVGVSGGSVDQDVEVAQSALRGIGASAKP